MKKSFTTIRCPVDGCTHGALSVPGLSAHLRKMHPKDWRGTVKKTLEKLGKADLVKEVDAAGMARAQRPKKKQKRKPGARRKPAARRTLQRAANREPVNFCPRCGCHLEAVGIAMAFTGHQQ